MRVADELDADDAAVTELISEITAPVSATLAGYEPGLSAAEALQRARDAALDELLGGEVR